MQSSLKLKLAGFMFLQYFIWGNIMRERLVRVGTGRGERGSPVAVAVRNWRSLTDDSRWCRDLSDLETRACRRRVYECR